MDASDFRREYSGPFGIFRHANGKVLTLSSQIYADSPSWQIDFDEKKGQGSFRFWNTSDDKVTDEITSAYEEPVCFQTNIHQKFQLTSLVD